MSWRRVECVLSSGLASAAVLFAASTGHCELQSVSNPAATDEAGLFRLRATRSALKSGGHKVGAALDSRDVERAVATAESRLSQGRREQAIADLAILVEREGFERWERRDSGRAALYYLGEALGGSGATTASRLVFRRLIEGKSQDVWLRRTVRRLVDFAQQSVEPEVWQQVLKGVSAPGSKSVTSALAYLQALVLERSGQLAPAVAQYELVGPESKYWAQARYRRGLLAVELGEMVEAEQAFCQVADPAHTPRLALITGGQQFFDVRDLSRVALGRVAHEQSRFDDARYYYHLVPGDSRLLPQALYEAATSRYEAKDYEASSALLKELRALGVSHPYEDEGWILEAYVELARCKFAPADVLLQKFSTRYEPVLKVVERLLQDPPALRALLRFESDRDESGLALIGLPKEAAQRVAALVRVDPVYESSAQKLSQARREVSGLETMHGQLVELKTRVGAGEGSAPVVSGEQVAAPKVSSQLLSDQLVNVERLIQQLSSSQAVASPRIEELRREHRLLESALKPLEPFQDPRPLPHSSGELLQGTLDQDLNRSSLLRGEVLQLANRLALRQSELAKEALIRVQLRLSRLLRRAQAGRVETVLGAKAAVELEIEALSQGLLPRGALDSMDVAQYLQDNEEYWPIDGEDWADEYVGGEGLR